MPKHDQAKIDLDEAGAKRILEATGIGFPESVSLKAFAKHVSNRISLFKVYCTLDDTARMRGYKSLESIFKTAAKLEQLLQPSNEADPLKFLEEAASDDGREIGGYADFGHPPLSWDYINTETQNFEPALDVLQDAVVRQAVEMVSLIKIWAEEALKYPSPEKGELSPTVRLIGYSLPKLFSSTFGKKIGIARQSDGTPDSPGIRFIEAILREAEIKNTAGENFSRETIVKYVQTIRANRTRRKEIGQTGK